MKKVLISYFIISFLFIVGFSYSEVKSNQFISVAVSDFESTIPKMERIGSQVSSIISANLSLDERIILVERQDLNRILEEMQLGMTGTISSDSAVKIGNLTGAKVLITGRVFEDKNKLYIAAKIIGVETGRVYTEMIVFPLEDSLNDEVVKLSAKIRNVILQKTDTLMVKEKKKEDVINSIKKLIEGKKLTVVAVEVRESHLRQLVVDPAVETELVYILKELGFEIVDRNKSEKKPEVLITGEAFSEFGTRKGGLAICKGRVEIKAIKVDNGQILTVERQK
ncbi:MAG TPA: CsgG/HfaB family protein [bacterium]|nr:CsgG/HfaB family protein [bacterium]HOM26133.1 CsgG/HfaB family protein [bacterium]